MSIVSANAFTPDNTPSSKFDTVSKNGDAFSINAAKLLPTSTNPAVEDAKKPPTIFPKNDPKPYPIFSRIDKPFETVDDEMPSASAISDVLYPDALNAPILFCLATLNVVVARGVAR